MPRPRFLPALAVCLLLVSTAAVAGGMPASKLHPALRMALKGLDEESPFGKNAGPDSYFKLMASDDGRLPCLIRLVADGISAEAIGIPIQTQSGRICTARLSPEEIDDLSNRPEITSISLAVQARPLLNRSVPEMGGTAAHNADGGTPPVYNGYAGEGIIIGIIDSGIDPYHPDFQGNGTTRILSIWDQMDDSGDPPVGFDGGSEWTQAEINNQTCTAVDDDGHGTHIAGIAAGNGSATGNGQAAYRFVGMAPEADLIIVKTSFYTDDIIDAASYIFGRADALGKPAVVNLSLGSHYGPHDGTEDFDIAFENLVEPNHLIVAAAGNELGDSIHAEVSVEQGGLATVTFDIAPYDPLAGTQNDYFAIDAWYDGSAELTITMQTPNGAILGPIFYGEVLDEMTGDGDVYIDNGYWDPPNGDENFHIYVLDVDAAHSPAPGTWTIYIEGAVVPTGLVPVETDLWVYLWSGPIPKFVQGVEEEEIVASPATADSVIAVAAYVTKPNWRSIDGNIYYYQGSIENGGIADFSSPGPRRDGVLKPEIAAPGMGIKSALSSDAFMYDAYIDPDGVHFLTQGTSMAAPHVAGTLALMLEAFGSLTAADALDQLTRTARADDFTGNVPNARWGYGKINASAATDINTPIMIEGIEATATAWGVRLAWNSPGDIQASSYQLLRALDDGSAPGELIQNAKMIAVVPRDGAGMVWEDRDLVQPGIYAYWIAAVFQGQVEYPAGPVYIDWSGPAGLNAELFQAMPNPFRPQTTLRLNLPRAGRVAVEVMDPAGRRIRTLVQDWLPAGLHRLIWDGRDEEDREVPSGLYFARVQAAGKVRVGRLVLIR